MSWLRRRVEPNDSPVLVVDALGISRRIEEMSAAGLPVLADELDRQFHRFRAKVPHKVMLVTKRGVYGSREFATLRLNDMFVLFSERVARHAALRFIVSASLLYQQLLIEGFLPRGGLGFGTVLRKGDMLLGAGFIDALRVAEKRPDKVRNVCAFAVSERFLRIIPNTEHSWRLVCLYQDWFFINPRVLTDPEMGEFDNERILSLLVEAGANSEKLAATRDFLENLEDYDAAKRPGSRSRYLTGWVPPAESKGNT